MDHCAGLDVSVKETTVCVVNDTGKIVREVKVASRAGALLSVLRNPAYHFNVRRLARWPSQAPGRMARIESWAKRTPRSSNNLS